MNTFTSAAKINPKYANLPPIEDDEDFPAPTILSKAQAVRLIDRLHQAVITVNALPDIDIDYRGMVDEAIRVEWTQDAIQRGYKRGSTKHGQMPCYREKRGKGCRIWFNEIEIIEWFEVNMQPILLKKSTHTTH